MALAEPSAIRLAPHLAPLLSKNILLPRVASHWAQPPLLLFPPAKHRPASLVCTYLPPFHLSLLPTLANSGELAIPVVCPVSPFSTGSELLESPGPGHLCVCSAQDRAWH